jgi:tRNA 2-thiouridine synthesizing protein A
LPRAPSTPQDGSMSETLLDMKGMNCPLPVLRANRALRTMAPGDRLRVLATDRAAVADFQAFCRETGHALLAWSEEGGVFSFVIRRRADPTEQDPAEQSPADPKDG